MYATSITFTGINNSHEKKNNRAVIGTITHGCDTRVTARPRRAVTLRIRLESVLPTVKLKLIRLTLSHIQETIL